MRAHTRDTSLGTGVYFSPGDYIGITRRMIILAVDVFVLVLGYIVFGTLYIGITGHDPSGTFHWSYLGLAWSYLTILKASRLRTVGYRLTGARILNLRGEQPSFLRMTFRLLLWLFGPFNLVFDLFWAGNDEDRQTLRDRFAGTCVVKRSAHPVGTGEIHFAYYNALGFNLMYPRVVRRTTSSAAVAAETSQST